MAIRYEFKKKRKDGVVVNRVFSDFGLMIRKVGTDYVDTCAYEVENSPHVYEELPITVEEYLAAMKEASDDEVSTA